MTVKKGLSKFSSSAPEFSTQALENAINEIKAVDKDDGHQFILSQFLVDEAIRDNTVLTTSQKNDALETINNAQTHLQIGRYLNDLIRHGKSIIDGTIVFLQNPDTEDVATFIEILGTVQGFQTSIPQLFGVPASEKNRAVDDHFGIIGGKFLTTEDSSEPVFTRLKKIMELIDTNSRNTSALNLAITNAATANLNLRTFLTTITDDSTDFQESLDNKVNSIVTMFSTLQTRISEIAGDPTVELIAIQDTVEKQLNLETSNLQGIRTYAESLSDAFSYVQFAEDTELKNLLVKLSQNPDFRNYLETYEENSANVNAIYNAPPGLTDDQLVDNLLAQAGLPDVLDRLDLEGVANKAQKDDRIDTAGFSGLSVESIITKSCQQLGISTNRSIYDQSKSLLDNLNKQDRKRFEDLVRLNKESDTIT